MTKNLSIPLILIIIVVLILAVFISHSPRIPIPISPTPTPTPIPTNTTILGEGERNGPLLIQKIYTDHIEGLSFIEYPISHGYGENITLYIRQSVSNGCSVTLTLTNIIQLQTYPPTYKAIFSNNISESLYSLNDEKSKL